LLVITLSTTCLGFGLFYFLFEEYYYKLFPVLPLFMFSITLIVHVYLVKASDGNPRKFTSKYLGAMGIKILIYIVFIFVFLAIDTANAIPFLASFLLMYASLTIFEVISILNTMKNNQ
jgi:hypothetical protein